MKSLNAIYFFIFLFFLVITSVPQVKAESFHNYLSPIVLIDYPNICPTGFFVYGLNKDGTLKCAILSGVNVSYNISYFSTYFVGFNTTSGGYLYNDTPNDLTFNESKLNNTIDSRIPPDVDNFFNSTDNIYLYNSTVYKVNLNESKLNSTILLLQTDWNASGLIINWSYLTNGFVTLSQLLGFNYYNSTSLQNLSQLTDDLGNRGYTSLSNFTNDEGFYNSTNPPPYPPETEPLWNGNYSTFLTHITWNQVMNGTLATWAEVINGTVISLANIGNWTADKGSYYTKTQVDNGFATKDEPLWTDNFTKYNSSWSSTYNSTYNMWTYNQTTPAIDTILGFHYYNSTNLPQFSGMNGTFNETEGVYVYNSSLYKIEFNETKLNLTIDERAINYSNDTIARIGNCISGEYVVNTTTSGVQCAMPTSSETLWNGNYSTFLTHISWATAMNGTLYQSSNPFGFYNSTNPSPEADTLASVTGRGATTTTTCAFQNSLGIVLGKQVPLIGNIAGQIKLWSAGVNSYSTTITTGTQTQTVAFTLPVDAGVSSPFTGLLRATFPTPTTGVLSWDGNSYLTSESDPKAYNGTLISWETAANGTLVKITQVNQSNPVFTNFTVSEIKTTAITLPGCAAGLTGDLGRNSTGIYICNGTCWGSNNNTRFLCARSLM